LIFIERYTTLEIRMTAYSYKTYSSTIAPMVKPFAEFIDIQRVKIISFIFGKS